MRELAAFALSESGRTHAEVHKFWGTDPAGFLEPDDDLGAANLRAALAVVLAEDESAEGGGDHKQMVERARVGGAAIREAMSG